MGSRLQDFFYVYVIRSVVDRQFYIGYSTDPFRRLVEHNTGKNPSTARRGQFDLIYFEGHLNKMDALRRERYLKTNQGHRSLKQMIREQLSE